MNIITNEVVPIRLTKKGKPDKRVRLISLSDRFWSRVDKKSDNECWNWLDHKMWGYGYFGIDGKDCRAHRVAWMLTNGPIPEGKQILHKCDNKACVNPKHLYVGTHMDNMRDIRERHRNPGGHGLPAGENHPNAKLKDADIIEIRKDFFSRGNLNRRKLPVYRELAEKYGVSPYTIYYIIFHKTRIDK